MTRTRAALLILALTVLPVGVWAQFAPHSFYTSFPAILGWTWVAPDGPYNGHLIRDVGGLHLALFTVLAGSFVQPGWVHPRAAGLAALVFSVPHLTYHVLHRHAVPDPLSSAASLVGIAVMVGCAGLLLLPVQQRRQSP